MITEYTYKWAVPIENKDIPKKAYAAIKSIRRMMDRGEAVKESDIEYVLLSCGFKFGEWKAEFDPRSLDWIVDMKGEIQCNAQDAERK